jgi:hypothetical protein
VASWLVLSYRVPTEPSALRVASWRALKQLGAVKLGDGVYLAPNTPTCTAAIEELGARIRSGGGIAVAMAATGLNVGDEALLGQAFEEARADEFGQVGRSAIKLSEHIAREEATDDYRFAEVDTLEEELEKVRRQFQRALDRDHLSSPAREAAASAVSDAARALSRFVDEAFRRENGLPERLVAADAVPVGVNGRSNN